MKTCNFTTMIETKKKKLCILEFNQPQWLKPYMEFNTQKNRRRKKNDKDRKVWYELMNNAIYKKTMENLKNRMIVKLVNNKKEYFKCTLKPNYKSHKIFDNNFVAMHKRKLALKLNKLDSLMYEIRTEDGYEDLSSNKEMRNFSNYLTKSKYYDNSNKSIIGKMKDETRSVAIEEFVGLNPKMYLFFVHNSKHKKAKHMNRNVIAATSNN